MAGIVIVILSVYLIQQGSLVPSTYHFGPGEPGVEADAPAGTGDGETGGGEATVPGGETGGAPAGAGTGAVGAGQTPSSGSGTGTAVAADPAGEPVRMVVDLEGEARATVGPLSREDCYRSMVSPATGKVVRPHGFYDSTLFQDTRYHTGVDIALKTGDPVRAALGGLVTHASHTSSEAWRIEITHGFGVVTVYSHLGAAHVRSGDMVTTGRHIGTAGLPGDLEFDLGVHLHFEIRVDGDSIDPAPYVGS
jgi:murein DD-endopeptidase MepM/ murein hydrolase activator NlpD